jgi:hypothetical protein
MEKNQKIFSSLLSKSNEELIESREAVSTFATILGQALTGNLTLKLGEAQDLQEALEEVPGLIKTEESSPEGLVLYRYTFVSVDNVESGSPLPGVRTGPQEIVPYGNCVWFVTCEQQGPDWIEKSRRCIGRRNQTPPCPLNLTLGVNH